MKLGASYNLFDGEELLEYSIKSIRSSVDYISIVYQTISNNGELANPDLLDKLQALKEKYNIDEIKLYQPDLSKGNHYNEMMKRNLGLFLSKRNGCTHHMSLDADELYLTDQLQFVKNDIIANDYDLTFCNMQTYYRDFDIVLDPPEDYYVTLIQKIREFTMFEFAIESPVVVDPTRRVKTSNPRIYTRDEIEMHHLSMIRDNMAKKLNNSSAKVNFAAHIDNIVKHYSEWVYPNEALLPGLPPKLNSVKKITSILERIE
jgi:hypothetical protein